MEKKTFRWNVLFPQTCINVLDIFLYRNFVSLWMNTYLSRWEFRFSACKRIINLIMPKWSFASSSFPSCKWSFWPHTLLLTVKVPGHSMLSSSFDFSSSLANLLGNYNWRTKAFLQTGVFQLSLRVWVLPYLPTVMFQCFEFIIFKSSKSILPSESTSKHTVVPLGIAWIDFGRWSQDFINSLWSLLLMFSYYRKRELFFQGGESPFG